jgi:hypothetical protein
MVRNRRVRRCQEGDQASKRPARSRVLGTVAGRTGMSGQVEGPLLGELFLRPVERCGGAVGVPRTRSWPDRSALASAVGEVILKDVGAALTSVWGLGLAADPRLGSLPFAVSAVRSFRLAYIGASRPLGLVESNARQTRIGQSIHRTPPRAARADPGAGPRDSGSWPIASPVPQPTVSSRPTARSPALRASAESPEVGPPPRPVKQATGSGAVPSSTPCCSLTRGLRFGQQTVNLRRAGPVFR